MSYTCVGVLDLTRGCPTRPGQTALRSSIRAYGGGKKNPEHKRRKRKKRAPRNGAAETNGAAPVLPAVTGPPRIETTRPLQTVAPALEPWWSTFVGHVEGIWAGKCAAFNMANGKMEPMMLTGDNVKMKELHTRVQESGSEIDEQQVLLRKTLKQIKLNHIEEFSEHAEKSCMMANAHGLVYFDGGSYSSSISDLGTNRVEDSEDLSDTEVFGGEQSESGWGNDTAPEGAEGSPEDAEAQLADVHAHASSTDVETLERDVWESAIDLGAPDQGDQGEGEDAEWRRVARLEMMEERYRGSAKVAPLEHCLSDGSHERVRLQVLLQTRGGREEELDVQVLRMVLFKEVWMGETERGAQPPLHTVNIAESHRADAHDHSGLFHCLTLTTAVLPPESAAEGGRSSDDAPSSDSEPVKACFSNEVEQQWGLPRKDFAEDGVTWWLPHDVTVTMAMQPTSQPPSSEELETGGAVQDPGLVIRTTWKRDAFISAMETEFDDTGKLVEARFSSLVPADNSIPSMDNPVKLQ